MLFLLHDFSQCPPHSLGTVTSARDVVSGIVMMIEMKTRRRWIMSVLEAVGEGQDTRLAARPGQRQNPARKMTQGQKGFAMRLKAATRPLADAAR